MKATLRVLLIFAAVLSGRADDSLAKNDWSEAVNGLRARLVFGDGKDFNGTRIAEVYLELHNGTDVGDPMEFDFDADKTLHFDLRSADGKPGPKPAGMEVDGFVFGPFHLTIPRDGTLRFPVTWSGYGIPRGAGTALGFMHGFWIIPADDPSDYFLSATFVVPESIQERSRPRCWHGTIKIPAVKVPIKKDRRA